MYNIQGSACALMGFIGGIGLPEMVIILIIGVILFGKRLPDVGRQVGKGLAEEVAAPKFEPPEPEAAEDAVRGDH